LVSSVADLFEAPLPQPFPWLIVIAAILGGLAGTSFFALYLFLTLFPVIAAIIFLVIIMRRQRAKDNSRFYTRLSENERAGPAPVPLTATRKEVRLVVVHMTHNTIENVLNLNVGEQATANPEDWVSPGEWVWVQARGQSGFYPKEWLRVQ
jgi:hypothetical protein